MDAGGARAAWRCASARDAEVLLDVLYAERRGENGAVTINGVDSRGRADGFFLPKISAGVQPEK